MRLLIMAALKLIPDLNDLRSSEDSLNKLIPKIKGNGKYMYGFGFCRRAYLSI